MPANELTATWVHALTQVSRRRSMLHYKPAALLTTLQILDDGLSANGRIPYSIYEPRFRDFLAPIDPKGATQAWEPFFHLATGNQVWRLSKAGTLLEVSPRMHPNRSCS